MHGVLHGSERMQEIVQAGLNSGKLIEGHARGLSGADLQAYLAAGVTSDHELTSADDALEKLRAGEDFGAAMHTSGLLSGLYARMVLLGIRTGETEKVMDDIARISQENLDNQIGQILSAIEPTLVIALSLIVGVILLSVMFPLMGIMSGI